MSDYSFVKRIVPGKPERQGGIVVGLCGGHRASNVNDMEATYKAAGGSDPIHVTPLAVSASGANTLWGTEPGIIAAYPTYYQGANATGLANQITN